MQTRANSFLKVFPNPYMKLDGFGNPAGAFAVDPTHDPGRSFVGATIDKVDILDTLKEGDLRSPRQDIYYKFDLNEPTLLPPTAYYVDALRCGYLFPADEETARKVSVEFRSKHDFLQDACKSARKLWKEMYMEECPLPAYKKPSDEFVVDSFASTDKKVEVKK